MKPIIRVENLSKQYRIGPRQAPYKTIRETIIDTFRAPFRAFAGNNNSPQSTIWALKDVSFEVVPGEVVGIIGRNGAGKSTLLRILSRITEPTNGGIDLYGRVGSLLEVGTGFHLELTGRENIYLNGAILGMKRSEIERRFDEIVTFAEIDTFLDTPVKHYSSGMHMRLAFAVAAHLEPEILVIDEVLAVGDVAFQKKCLGKMSEVASQGRTVLFVSHSMPAVQSLCHSALVLSGGQIKFRGSVDQAIRRYLNESDVEAGGCDLRSVKNRTGSGEAQLTRFWIEDERGVPVTTIPSGSNCSLAVEYLCFDGKPRRNLFMSYSIFTLSGAPVTVVNTALLGQDFITAPPVGIIKFEIPKLALTAGRYVVDLYLATHNGYTPVDDIKGAAAFDVAEGDFYGTGRSGSRHAPMLIEGNWKLEDLPAHVTA